MTLILGTSSQFRRKLFQESFSEFISKDEKIEQFISPDIDEKAIRDSDSEKLCQKIAVAKCDAILKEYEGKLPNNSIILTFDQVVVCDGELREKPVDESEARKFLKSYSEGSPAIALSGVVAHNIANGKRECLLDKVTVKFTNIPDHVVNHLLKVGEIFLASGSFTIGDRELGKYVEHLDGTLDAIEGLPIAALKTAIETVCDTIKFTVIEKPLATITHILFDMDGLLLDTEVLYTVAQNKILEPFGIKFSAEVKSMMMGRKALEAAEIMVKHYGIDLDPAKFVADRNVLLEEMFPNCDLMPGVLRLLLHLKLHGVPMAIATSSHKRHFDLKTTKHIELFNKMFNHVVTGDDVVKSKPEPEIFLIAAEKFGENIDPSKVLVFEDAHLGVEAANRAGMNVVWVYDEQNYPNPAVKSTLSIKSLFDLKPELFGLPPF